MNKRPVPMLKWFARVLWLLVASVSVDALLWHLMTKAHWKLSAAIQPFAFVVALEAAIIGVIANNTFLDLKYGPRKRSG